MSEKQKKARFIGLGKVVGIAIIMLFIGILIGTILSFTVVAPGLQKLQINLPGFSTNDQSNPNDNNSGDNSGNQNQGIHNDNQAPSNPISSYGGNGDFQITIPTGNGDITGKMTANINCLVQTNGNNIQLSLDLTPTSVTGSLQQAINPDKGNQIFNFVGTISTGTQFTANSQGSVGSGDNIQTFNFNLSGTIDSNTLTFMAISQSNSQIGLSTQEITLHNNS